MAPAVEMSNFLAIVTSECLGRRRDVGNAVFAGPLWRLGGAVVCWPVVHCAARVCSGAFRHATCVL